MKEVKLIVTILVDREEIEEHNLFVRSSANPFTYQTTRMSEELDTDPNNWDDQMLMVALENSVGSITISTDEE
jgi:hypothetical protein